MKIESKICNKENQQECRLKVEVWIGIVRNKKALKKIAVRGKFNKSKGLINT